MSSFVILLTLPPTPPIACLWTPMLRGGGCSGRWGRHWCPPWCLNTLFQYWTPLSAVASLKAFPLLPPLYNRRNANPTEVVPPLGAFTKDENRKYCDFLNFSSNTRILLMLWRLPPDLTLGSSSYAFPLTTFFLLKFGYLIHLNLLNIWASSHTFILWHHFSLWNSMRFREM